MLPRAVRAHEQLFHDLRPFAALIVGLTPDDGTTAAYGPPVHGAAAAGGVLPRPRLHDNLLAADSLTDDLLANLAPKHSGIPSRLSGTGLSLKIMAAGTTGLADVNLGAAPRTQLVPGLEGR
jgi:hypothetical protein